MSGRTHACRVRAGFADPLALCVLALLVQKSRNTDAARASPSAVDTQRKGERHSAAAAAAAAAVAAAEDQRVVLGLQVCLKAFSY